VSLMALRERHEAWDYMKVLAQSGLSAATCIWKGTVTAKDNVTFSHSAF
jgi:hypothetical protein